MVPGWFMLDPLFGVGAGMMLIFAVVSMLGILVGFGGYIFPIIRNVEDIIPDYDEVIEVLLNGETI